MYACLMWNMTIILDVGGCAIVFISNSSKVSTTSHHHIFGVVTSCLLHILNIHYSRGSFPPYLYMVTNIYPKCYDCYHCLLYSSDNGRPQNSTND